MKIDCLHYNKEKKKCKIGLAMCGIWRCCLKWRIQWENKCNIYNKRLTDKTGEAE